MLRSKHRPAKIDVPAPGLAAAIREIDRGAGVECNSIDDMYSTCGVKRRDKKKSSELDRK